MRASTARGILRRTSSGFDGDDARLDLAFYRPGAEAPRERFLGGIGGLVKPGSAARLDLASQRRPLAVADRGHPGGCGAAARRDRLDAGGLSESTGLRAAL